MNQTGSNETQVVALEQILFLDIETAPLYRSLHEVPEILRDYWLRVYDGEREKKHPSLTQEEYFQNKAAVHALFGRVICINMGYFAKPGPELTTWKQADLYSLDEENLLHCFLEKWERFRSHASKIGQSNDKSRSIYAVCGHNILNFDIPFLGRRLLINQLPLPDFWRAAQWMKEWQLRDPTIIDTMHLWSFTSRDSRYISLEMLAYAVGIPFKKSLTHDEIHAAFATWEDTQDAGAFLPVVQYCADDVRTTAEIYVRMQLPAHRQAEYIAALRTKSTESAL